MGQVESVWGMAGLRCAPVAAPETRTAIQAFWEDLLAHSFTTIHPSFLKVLEEYILGRKTIRLFELVGALGVAIPEGHYPAPTQRVTAGSVGKGSAGTRSGTRTFLSRSPAGSARSASVSAVRTCVDTPILDR